MNKTCACWLWNNKLAAVKEEKFRCYFGVPVGLRSPHRPIGTGGRQRVRRVSVHPYGVGERFGRILRQGRLRKKPGDLPRQQAAALIAKEPLRCNCAISRPCAKWRKVEHSNTTTFLPRRPLTCSVRF